MDLWYARDSWYRHGLMVKTRTHGVDKDSWYRYTHGIDNTYGIDLVHGIESVLLNHTHKRAPSVTRMRDLKKNIQGNKL